MRAAGLEARVASPCGGAATSPAPGSGANDAQSALDSNEALHVSIDPREEEKSTHKLDESVDPIPSTNATEAVEENSATTQASEEATGTSEAPSICSACVQAEGPSERGVVLVCADCGVAVHASCYGRQAAHEPLAATLHGDTTANQAWKCDCCVHGLSPSAVSCVYCCQPGSDAMRAVDTSEASWQSILPSDQATSVEQVQGDTPHFGHLLCISWDPWSLASSVQDPIEPQSTSTTTTTATNATPDQEEDAASGRRPLIDARGLLEPDACCFCASSAGVRIQCRRLHCGRFFHAMCASKDGCGYLEHVDAGAMSQLHAYCSRHRACREDVVSFLEKLVSKPVASLVGRDDARRFHTLLKRVPTYTRIEALLDDIAALLVGFCHKGLHSSRSDPPTFPIKHLQVLQLFLDHVPQLEVTYGLQPIAAKVRVGDAKLFQHLVRTFNPPRYLSRLPGPLSQQHACAVCLEPFLERQHLFYCTNATEPHELHWQCTKRAPAASTSARDRHAANGSSKKKKQSATGTVSHGVWTDVKLPSALSSVERGVVCSVCASPIDLRGLIASDTDAARLPFEEKPSVFAYHGCFVNATSHSSHGRTSRGSSPARTAAVASSSRPPAKSAAAGGRSSRRPLAASSATDSAKAPTVANDEPTGPVELAPPKMERINVQRTARWLACVGQIIRLAGRAREGASASVGEKETKSISDGAKPDEPMPDVSVCSPSQQQRADEPMRSAGDVEEASGALDSSLEKEPSRSEKYEDGDRSLHSLPLTVSVDAASSSTPHVEMKSGKETERAAGAPEATMEAATSTSRDSAAPNTRGDDGTLTTGSTAGPVGAPTADPSAMDGSPSAGHDRLDRYSLLSPDMQAYFDEAVRVVRPFDPYALARIETAREMLARRSGPGVAVLRMLAHEYTRFVHAKHVRAADKVRAEKRKREELEAEQQRAREQRRVDREAELALKKKMLAMRKKQRTHMLEQA